MHAQCALLFLWAIQLPNVLSIHNIITTYCMNKRGFHCALSFCPFFSSLSFLPLAPFLSFFSSIFPRLRTLFLFRFLLLSLYPGRSRTTYLSHNSLLLVSLVHYYTTRFSWKLPLDKSVLLHLTRLNAEKFKCMFHAARKHASLVFILGFLVNKRRDDLI